MSNDERTTPLELFVVLETLYGPFSLDVAARAHNSLLPLFCTDGLVEPWADRNWCNPPYSRGQLTRWMHKAAKEASAGKSSLCLIPAAVGTRWFLENVVELSARMVFLVGRVPFGNGAGSDDETGAKFDSCVALFGPAFEDLQLVSWLDWKAWLKP